MIIELLKKVSFHFDGINFKEEKYIFKQINKWKTFYCLKNTL